MSHPYPNISNATITALLLITILFCSCANTKKAIYFNNVASGDIATNIIALEPIIQKNDLLSISVSSLSAEASDLFNGPNTTTTSLSTGGTSLSSGYLVNQTGYIEFPLLGEVKAAGITRNELKNNIKKSLIDKKLLLDPIINIRFLNFKVTILGEVTRPTVVNVSNEKISLLEALGLAGDITVYGKRDNVMVIREEEGKKILRRINLNSGEIFTSPYFYLKSNDIVYVEANKAKVASTSRANQWLPILLSGLSFAAIILDRLL